MTDSGARHPNGTGKVILSLTQYLDLQPWALQSSEVSNGPIAVVGMSFTMPQGINSDASLWEILATKKNVMTEWPASRANVKGFTDTSVPTMPNTLRARGGHFMTKDLAVFDAPFFGITAREAAGLDPQQRWALEAAYHAFENAGIPMESVRGSRTAVFGASMTDDYAHMVCKDPDTAQRQTVIGTAPTSLPNRVSWYFDLRGPSIHVNTACSSSLIALDLACQSMRCGDADAALVIGTSALLSPETSVYLSSMNFVSPDSRSFSFDSRGNGYGRGEGVVALFIKPVHSALENGDVIRAVIRMTASNQDGHTLGYTQPSTEAQETLIRHVYAKAGLDFKETRFFEAHGTGTSAGDPIEMKAIGRVFRPSRSPENPLYVGSVKSNIGHLEGASGLAGIVKSILAIEKGTVPPNALLQKLNPNIDADFYNVKVPTECVPWPMAGLRRASVNSFGFGGANAHVILDDACHFLQSNNLSGNHNCYRPSPSPPATANQSASTGYDHQSTNAEGIFPSKLLFWSAADAGALKRMIKSYEGYVSAMDCTNTMTDRLAYTLAVRRSLLPWRAFSVVQPTTISQNAEMPSTLHLHASVPVRASVERKCMAFVFTGQGAQYEAMGLGLLVYPVFRKSLDRSSAIFATFGCQWSLLDELRSGSRINHPELSQPLCTALQIGLVDLLRSFQITASAALGHSSGEIAAAYAIGYLSQESACKIAFYRGVVAGELRSSDPSGAMMAVNLEESDIPVYLQQAGLLEDDTAKINVACINGPRNLTLSGPSKLLEMLKTSLDQKGVFGRKLNTGVAYHSPAMKTVAAEYKLLLGRLKGPEQARHGSCETGPLISSVTGTVVAGTILLDPQYWVDNLVSPVRFSDALQCLTTVSDGAAMLSLRLPFDSGTLTDLIEIGPHGALRRPVKDVLASTKASALRYHTVLERHQPAMRSTLSLLGALFCLGHPVSILAGNLHDEPEESPAPLVDCPPYPFDDSRRYWNESRLSKDYRLRPYTPGYLLGRQAHDFNALQPRWRNWLSTEAIPWLEDHVITQNTLCPGAGMLVMSIEAIYQAMSGTSRPIAGFLVNEAEFISPIRVSETTDDAVETDLQLLPVQKALEKDSARYEVKIHCHHGGRSILCFTANIQVDFDEDNHNLPVCSIGRSQKRERQLYHSRVFQRFLHTQEECGRTIDQKAFYDYCRKHGLNYGKTFQLLSNIKWDGHNASTARLQTNTTIQLGGASPSPVHPAALDCIIQLILTQFSKGVDPSFKAPTLVPQRLRKGWISAKPWRDAASGLRLSSVLHEDIGRAGSINASVYVLTDDGSVLCVFEDLTMAEVARSNQTTDEDTDLLYGIAWKPQLSLMRNGDMQRLVDEEASHANSDAMMSFFPKIERAMRVAACKAVVGLPGEVLEASPLHIRKFAEAIRHLFLNSNNQRLSNGDNSLNESQLETLLKECEEEVPDLALFTIVARALPGILRGTEDPLEILFQSGAAERFYARMFEENIRDGRLASFLDLKSHEIPSLRILEVGAGTGGFTGHILEALHNIEIQTGTVRFAEYVYTDISPAYFEAGRDKFARFSDRMVFKPLDLEKDLGAQGFQDSLERFDIVVAGSVLHATSNLEKTLERLRTLTKPDGQIVFFEIPCPDNACINVAFGSLEGWWLSTEDFRQFSPLVTTETWGRLLQKTGFSGLDLVLRDHQSDICHISTIIVSTATQTRHDHEHKTNGVPIGVANGVVNGVDRHLRKMPVLGLLIHADSNIQKEMAMKIIELYPNARVVPLHETQDKQTEELQSHRVLVSLLDIGKASLSSISMDDFALLKSRLQKETNLLWVASSTADDISAGDPHLFIAAGFLRSLRTEEDSKRIITLTIESCASGRETEFVNTVLKSSFLNRATNTADEESGLHQEEEFIVRNNVVTIGRMVKDVDLESDRLACLVPQLQQAPWRPGPPLQLEVGTPGMLDTLRFVEDESYRNDLEPGFVEIEATAWALSFRDLFIALGRLDAEGIGIDCAGVVTRVGPNLVSGKPSFQPGDRVVMIVPGCMRSHPRAPAEACLKIPGDVSFEEAVSILNPGLTAYHCLVNIARLQPGEKVLIHSAASGTGQMAVHVAKMLGAEVFVTVGSDEKKELVMRESGIAEDHIFYSRNTSFVQGLKRITNGYGVDVLLNSLSGSMLEASWDCLAPFGRFIEIGKVDIRSNSRLPMAGFGANRTFAAVDMFYISLHNRALQLRLLEQAMDLFHSGHIPGPKPLHIYRVSRVEEAFRLMQSGKNTGRIVVSISATESVPKLLKHRVTWSFDPNATYLVAGGLGGLGRAILKWMASKGAKYLLAPTRSGVKTETAKDLIDALESKGVKVLAPRCDISSAAGLSNLLRDCANLPPIKGCINSAMALQDSVFDNMTHAQWSATIRSKVDTSWNLHTLLPQNMDFFILLSSLAGIYGPIAQTNYAAGGTFQDALARYRTSLGLRSSVSLDLGWMRTIGVVAESELYQRNRESARDMRPVEEEDLFILLDRFCDPNLQHLGPDQSQVLVGAVIPAHFFARGEQPMPSLKRRLFAGFDTAFRREARRSDDELDQQSPAHLFQQATSRKSRAGIVVEAIKLRLARALGVEADDIDSHRGLSDFGVDSLMAVELRNWIRRSFGAVVSVFEIMNARSIEGVGELVIIRAEEENAPHAPAALAEQ